MSAKRGRGRPPLARGEPTEKLTIKLPASIKAELKEHAERLGAPAAVLVRDAVDRELRRLRRLAG